MKQTLLNASHIPLRSTKERKLSINVCCRWWGWWFLPWEAWLHKKQTSLLFPLQPAAPKHQSPAMAPGNRNSYFLGYPCSFFASQTCPHTPVSLCCPTRDDWGSAHHILSMEPSQTCDFHKNQSPGSHASLYLLCIFLTRVNITRDLLYTKKKKKCPLCLLCLFKGLNRRIYSNT